MVIPLKNCRVEQNNHSFLTNWLDWGSDLRIYSQSRLICPFISFSVVQFHDAIWSAFGLHRLPLFSHSASRRLLHLSLFCPKHNTTRRSLWVLVLSHSDTLTTSSGLWHSEGATKEVTSLAAHRGTGVWCGCHEILIPLCYLDEVFCSDQTKSKLNRSSLSRCKGKRSEMTMKRECETRNKLILMSERMWCHEMVDPLLNNCPVFFVGFLWFIINCVWTLDFSVPLCECWLWSLLSRLSILKNSSTEWQSSFQNGSVAWNNHHFLANWTDWVLSSHYLLWLLDILPDYISLGSTEPFGLLENSSILSLHLTLPAAVQSTTAEGVLSWCWCSLSVWPSLPQ